MNKEEGEKKNIRIHWWNLGNKTLDFNGTVKDYLKKKDIKITRISNRFDKTIKGYRFKIPLSSCCVTLDIFRPDYVECVNEAIKVFLTLLGDKTKYFCPYGREFNINWR